MNRLLLDSVILIDHFNAIEPATRFLRDHFDEACISPITRAEVLVGFEAPDERRLALAVLDRLPLLPLDGPVADVAAQLRRERRWKLPDAFQAALAQVHGLRLATRNTRDFDPASDDFVIVPYVLP